MLCYQEAPAAIDFLCRAFGFEEAYRMTMDDGRVGHAELRHHDNAIMVASVWPDLGLASPQDLPAVPNQIQCFVDDVDAHYRHAREAGATIAAEPADQFYGARIYRAVDLEGHRWIFATQTRNVDLNDLEVPS
ncbi:MAG: VOC family protein [Deltaproteobacteria bacterium]|nr:VOC family protein [Deltaproteobacteria bacterium]